MKDNVNEAFKVPTKLLASVPCSLYKLGIGLKVYKKRNGVRGMLQTPANLILLLKLWMNRVECSFGPDFST